MPNQLTINLLAANVRLQRDAAQIRAQLAEPALDWEDVLYLADGHGITPLLYCQWRELDLLNLLPEPARNRMAQAYADNAARNADARREFAELLARMTGIGVETIVLKGLPLLLRLYPDPAQRVLYDFDLLTKNIAQAQCGYNALLADGYTPVPSNAAVNKHLPSLWRLNGFVRRGYLFDVAQPRPVELHTNLWDKEWRGLDVRPLPELWARSELVQMDGMSVPVLSREDTFLHLCVHLAVHLFERGARLGQVIDVARLLMLDGAPLDWEYTLNAGDAAHISRFVYLALRAVDLLTGAPMPPAAVLNHLRGQTPPRLQQWVEQHSAHDLLALDYRKPDLSQAYTLTFAATQSWREKASVVRFALVPSRETLAEEYGTRSPWVYARHIGGRGRMYLHSLAQRRAH